MMFLVLFLFLLPIIIVGFCMAVEFDFSPKKPKDMNLSA
jgi:hypothetical protein